MRGSTRRQEGLELKRQEEDWFREGEGGGAKDLTDTMARDGSTGDDYGVPAARLGRG